MASYMVELSFMLNFVPFCTRYFVVFSLYFDDMPINVDLIFLLLHCFQQKELQLNLEDSLMT